MMDPRLLISERELQDAIVEMAKMLGWLVYHTHDSRRSEPGFPDLVFVRERVVFAELKSEKGRLSHAQSKWLDELRAAKAEVYIWRPSDWTGGNVQRVLQERERLA